MISRREQAGESIVARHWLIPKPASVREVVPILMGAVRFVRFDKDQTEALRVSMNQIIGSVSSDGDNDVSIACCLIEVFSQYCIQHLRDFPGKTSQPDVVLDTNTVEEIITVMYQPQESVKF